MQNFINIIHLENDSNDVELVSEVLRNADIKCNIDIVDSEAEFKKYLNSKEYDLILGDYTLPGYDGLSALEYTKNNFSHIPFILVSGSIEEDAGIESLLHGASDYISKRKLSRLVPAVIKSLNLAKEQKQREEAELKLKESEESLSLAQQVGNIGSWDYNISTDKLSWSNQAYIQFGLKPGEIKPSDETFQKFVHPDDREKIKLAVAETFKNDTPYSLDAKMLRADGSVWYMHTHGKVIRDNKGNPVRFIGIQQDITKRKLVEEKLQESKIRFKSLFEDNLAGIYKSTVEGKLLECNATFAKIFGYGSIEDVLNSSATNFYLTPNDRKEFLQNLKTEKRLINNQTQMRRKDGSVIWITENVRLLDNSVMLGTLIDTTATRKMTRELIEAKNEAEKADKLKSEFLAQMSHEIRTPINTILNSISMIKMETPETFNSEVVYFYEAIERASSRLIRTIELILNMSEIQLGNFIPKMENINIEADVIKQLVHEFKSVAIKKDIELIYSIQTKQNIVTCDEYSLLQIFANLIDNAIKYTKEGSVELILYSTESGELNIDVVDTGIGIEDDYIPYLFESFSQEQQGYTRSFEGNGLGMALVKGYCNINKLSISVKSKKGEGTTFTVTFPKNVVVN